MDLELKNKPKTIREALADGTLVEMAEEAKKVNLKCRLFMSPSLVKKDQAVAPNNLHNSLDLIASIHNFYTGYNIFGALDNGDRLRIMEPHEEYGLILLIIEKGLNIERSSEDYKQFVM